MSILRASSLRSFGSRKNTASTEYLENHLTKDNVIKEDKDVTPKENVDEKRLAEGEANNLQVPAEEGTERTEDKANPVLLLVPTGAEENVKREETCDEILLSPDAKLLSTDKKK